MNTEPVSLPHLHNEFRLRVAALLYFLSRASVVAFVSLVPAFYCARGAVEVIWVLGGAGLVAALFTGYGLAASGVQCASCSSPVFMDNGNRKHTQAPKLLGLSHRARVAGDALFSSGYQCMYCMARCRCPQNAGGWGKSVRTSIYNGQQGGEDSFDSSIFSDVGDPLVNTEIFPAPGKPDMQPEPVAATHPVKFPAPPTPAGFNAASVFPNARTVPVSLAKPPPAPPAAREPVTGEPSLPGMLFSARPGSQSFPVPPPATGSVRLNSTPAKEVPMTHQFTDPSAAPNPFLAAAAAMPPPPSPMLPVIASSRTRPQPAPDFQQEFPHPASAAPAEGPPPWTLPAILETGRGITSAVPPSSAVAPSPAVADLLREVVHVLGDGQRTLANAFNGIITRLESHLAAATRPPLPATPAPLPAAFAAPPTTPVLTVPVPTALVNDRPELPELLAPILPAPPAPLPAQVRTSSVPPPKPILPPVPPAVAPQAPAPPRGEPSPVFMPSLPLPVAGPPAPAPFHAPALEPIPPAPRRRFARPTSLTAGELNQVLEEAFRVPEAPNGSQYALWPAAGNGASQNGKGKTSFIPPPPPTAPTGYQPAPAPRQFAPEQPLQLGAYSSPFGISDAPLTSPPGALLEPVPFTFLKHDGDHFSPASSGTDPLDDDLVPWMQPISLGQPRKN